MRWYEWLIGVALLMAATGLLMLSWADRDVDQLAPVSDPNDNMCPDCMP